MDIFEALYTRRSIRKYTTEDISDNDLHAILKAAMLAPSAKNEQPWHFVVCKDATVREQLSRTTPYTHMAKDAPVNIVVCAVTDAENSEGFWPQDCAAAIENLMLAARGKGIGSVWCGLHPIHEREKTVRNILGLPDAIVPIGLVCLGHPAQKFEEADRYDERRIHHDRW